jgi:hypothetical protein
MPITSARRLARGGHHNDTTPRTADSETVVKGYQEACNMGYQRLYSTLTPPLTALPHGTAKETPRIVGDATGERETAWEETGMCRNNDRDDHEPEEMGMWWVGTTANKDNCEDGDDVIDENSMRTVTVTKIGMVAEDED